MEAKLKSLKVADLRDICTRANVPTTTRSTKADLIAKILASQPAIDAYNVKYQQNSNIALPSKPPTSSSQDEVLAPPERVDWSLEYLTPSAPVPAAVSQPSNTNASTKPAPPAAKPQSNVVAPKSTHGVSVAAKPSVAAPPIPFDEELEKRKARAARFGIALIEPPKPKTKSVPPSKPAKAADDAEKLRARAERFGYATPEQTDAPTVPAVGSKKRGTTVVEEVDLEEQERRRKRAERFGISVLGAKA
ncbi:hypothetical protein F5148DRAFT_1205055 [Russula earlei]|uniref:Uncharacterized protein n=1 Tax=Russula earlei TaxID=71964 RepID=A0ACC0U748_9AGAM|nr:hypothetical protein F5148DRAFT_1205055 [Russula earlei]